MSEKMTRDQLEKLAAALHVPSTRIEYLSSLGGERLAVLCEEILRVLHTRYPREYRRYSALAQRVPLRFGLPLAIRVLPPRILGRALSAGLLDGRSDASLAMLSAIDPAVVASTAPFLNPAVVGRLAEFASPELISGVMAELMARNDFDTADLFVDTFTSHIMTGGRPAAAAAKPEGVPARGVRGLLRGIGRRP
ncbi:hypothetical protein [Nocardia australiensis]|uniref:hypothetical protein n=1 Tax=Nocardia australiensis TaxID=2887191 RepID=UPI001D136C6E|nr:hypothetical protein [Nocardia australiensis]